MERQEFLKTLGISFAAVCAGSCLAACSGGSDDSSTPNNQNPPPLTGGSVTANLSDLTSVGSQTRVNNVLFFRIATGNTPSSFVAVQAQCTHQAGTLNWVQNQDLIRCALHSAAFNKDGSVISGPVNSSGNATPLRVYSTTVNATSVIATT